MDEEIKKIIDKQMEILNDIKRKCWKAWDIDPGGASELVIKTADSTILAIYHEVNKDIRGKEADKSRMELEKMRNKRYLNPPSKPMGLATEKQKNILRENKIVFDENILTSEKAYDIIKKIFETKTKEESFHAIVQND